MKTNTHWGDDTVNIDNAIIPSLKWLLFFTSKYAEGLGI